MDKNNPEEKGLAPKTAAASLLLGIGSLIAMVLAIVIGIKVEDIGILSLFRGLVLPISVAAIVLGFLALRKITAEGLEGQRIATIGIVLGGITLVLISIAVVAAIAFFAPWLSA